jgi:hypothetical protein
MAGLGTSFTNFGDVTVDSGTNWTFAGQNTVAAGVTLTNSGTLTNGGTLDVDGALVATGTLVNTGTITNAPGNGVVLEAGGSVANLGTDALITGDFMASKAVLEEAPSPTMAPYPASTAYPYPTAAAWRISGRKRQSPDNIMESSLAAPAATAR